MGFCLFLSGEGGGHPHGESKSSIAYHRSTVHSCPPPMGGWAVGTATCLLAIEKMALTCGVTLVKHGCFVVRVRGICWGTSSLFAHKGYVVGPERPLPSIASNRYPNQVP